MHRDHQGTKRKRVDTIADTDARDDTSTRTSTTKKPRRTRHHDLLSPLSDELLVRILSFLPLPDLLNTAPLSRRFHALSTDSQLWKSLYYARFVLPRALRIPGFRHAFARDGKLHYASTRTVRSHSSKGGRLHTNDTGETSGGGAGDWKRQYKLRHNWSLGKCAVEELNIQAESLQNEQISRRAASQHHKTLVKVSEGVAVTADSSTGLRAWDLKTKVLLAHTSLVDAQSAAAPSCIAVDEQKLHENLLDVAIGFADGSFGVWRVDIPRRTVVRRYRHEKSSNGSLIGMAYSHPYVLTATKSVLISLYTFNVPEVLPHTSTRLPSRHPNSAQTDDETERESIAENHTEDEYESREPRPRRYFSKSENHETAKTNYKAKHTGGGILLPAPYLLTSLKSHTSRDPLALSIRKTAGSTTVASIAYTFSTIQGWSLGIQDLHIRPPLPAQNSGGGSAAAADAAGASPEIVTTRLAYTLPVRTAPRRRTRQPLIFARRRSRRGVLPHTSSSDDETERQETSDDEGLLDGSGGEQGQVEAADEEEGPTSICYTHPYLLATLPDNTLILHLCTSTSTSLSISPGIRLWGHTSGISDAEITARGKAVSVSCRGDEIRVWELEGRGSQSSPSTEGRRSEGALGGLGARKPQTSNGSIAVRPTPRAAERLHTGEERERDKPSLAAAESGQEQWDERRNWVGFDDEMVIVLKESSDGKESLLVYDFT